MEEKCCENTGSTEMVQYIRKRSSNSLLDEITWPVARRSRAQRIREKIGSIGGKSAPIQIEINLTHIPHLGFPSFLRWFADLLTFEFRAP